MTAEANSVGFPGTPNPEPIEGRARSWAPVELSEPNDADVSSLIDIYLRDQKKLTAVERFSQRHESVLGHNQAKFYRDLIPGGLPAPGQQYAFEVNLDLCSGCKACVSACHSLNGLDENETWREVGVLIHGPKKRFPKGKSIPLQPASPPPAMQFVTTACHHCVDPGCLNGCPVLAYEKDPVTGIVRHLDDQCIGCSYCVMKCPYDVPKYSASRGIVRKCDMCHGRLAVGEAPACVQGCPSQAISIRIVDQQNVMDRAVRTEFLPDSPDPIHTKPSTRYITSHDTSDLVGLDEHRLAPQPAHWPLAAFLVLSQAAAGGFLAAALESPLKRSAVMAGSLLWLILGMTCSVFHLGQPLKAWRSFLGWRRSWLSREIIALSGFASFAVIATAGSWIARSSIVQKAAPAALVEIFRSSATVTPIAWLAALSGVAAVGCSVMVYVDTGREFWSFKKTGFRFFGSMLALGAASSWAFAGGNAAPLILTLLTTLRIAEAMLASAFPNSASLRKSAQLVRGPLRGTALACLVLWAVGGLGLPLLALVGFPGALYAWPALAAILAGDLAERTLFFAAVAPAKMPGGLA